MATHDVIFLFDVDNTLLDNDRAATDRARGMVPHAAQTREIMTIRSRDEGVSG